MFLNTNFVALTAFQNRYGVPNADGTGKTIPTKWQSALFQSGQCGAFLGVFLAGPITTRIGYRWTTILALILMNATIFISFFVSGLSIETADMLRVNGIQLIKFSTSRPIPWLSSSLANCLRVFPGVCSSPTPPPTLLRSCLWLFVVPSPLPFRCLGRSVRSLSPPPLTATTRDLISGLGECPLLCSGSSP